MLRLLLDENLPASVAGALQSAGYDAVPVRALLRAGAADEDVFRVAVADRRVLVTRDLDFSDILRFPLGSHHGVVVLRLPNTTSALAIAQVLLARLQPLSDDEVRGNLFVVTATLMRVRVRPDPP